MATSPIPPMLIELQLETAKIQGQMQALQGQFETMGKNVEKSGNSFTKFKELALGVFGGNLLTQGMMGMEEQLKRVVDEMAKNEQAQARLQVALKNTGQASEKNNAIIEEQSKALLNLGFSVAETKNAYGTLLTATNSVSDATKLSAMAADLARYKHIDLNTAATILARGTQGSTKAFKEMGITLDTTLPKNVAIGKAFDELNQKIGGQATAYTKTFSGQIAVMKTKFDEFGVTLGSKILPLLTDLLGWISKNGQAILVYGGIVLGMIAIYKTYTAITAASKAVQQAYAFWTYSQAASTSVFKFAMQGLNTAIKANPIGLMVTALMLLGAAFIWAWNKFEGFRKVVVTGIQIVLNAIGYLVGGVGSFLKLMGKIPGIGGPFKAAGKSVDEFANAIRKTSDGLDSLIKKTAAVKTDTKLDLSTVTGLTTTDAAKAAKAAAKQKASDIKKANDEVVKLYKEMNTAIADGEKKAAEATKAYDKSVIDTKAKYADQAIKIEEKKNAELAANEKKWTAAYAKANAANEAEIIKITEQYDAKKKSIETAYTDEKIKLYEEANKKILDAQQKAAADQASITQQSIDLLRNAFMKGLKFDFKDVFTSQGGATGLLDSLKTQLKGAQDLQKNAGSLAAAGYSQTFIQQVVEAGPVMGNEMAQSILNADKGTQDQLRTLYSSLDNITNTGLDALGATMNQGGKLATAELMAAYNQVPKDLAITLADINSQLNSDLAKAQTDYTNNLADAAATRDAAIADSKTKLTDALDAADQALADANTQTMTDFNDALAKNAADLADALAQIQKDYEDKIQAINDATKTKLDDLQTQLLAVIQTLKDLGQAQAAVDAAALSPFATYVPPTTNPIPDTVGGKAFNKKNPIAVTNNYTVPQTFYATGNDPQAIAQATLTGIKYGAAITVGGGKGAVAE